MRRNSSRETTIHHPIRGIPETKTRWSCLAELYTDEAGKRGVVWYVKICKIFESLKKFEVTLNYHQLPCLIFCWVYFQAGVWLKRLPHIPVF